MRYFTSLAYNGSRYHGWQKQPNSLSVQNVLEDKLSMLLRASIEVIGCGRTDTGVHASQYFCHFDCANIPPDLVYRINKVLPNDIVIYDIFEVPPEAHTRFDAERRSYAYFMEKDKNPFQQGQVWQFPFWEKLDILKLQEAAKLIKDYKEFAPFCKAHSDTMTMKCAISRSEWEFDDINQRLIYHISADRFLRGMVRLIVGMCVNVSLGQLSLESVRQSLDMQSPLLKSYSVPPDGLFLTEVSYPFLKGKTK